MPPRSHIEEISLGDPALASRLHDNRKDGAFYVMLMQKETTPPRVNCYLLPGYYLRNMLKHDQEATHDQELTLRQLTDRHRPEDLVAMWLQTNSWYLFDPEAQQN